VTADGNSATLDSAGGHKPHDQFLLITVLLAWDWLYPTEIQIVNTGLKPRVNHGVVSLPLVKTNGKRDHLYRSLPLVKTKR
jgi:hypothetical protein